ncbi:hypothetical protein D3C72_2517930 [compost metagenome]
MHLVIDHAWHQPAAIGVEFDARLGVVDARGDFFDAPVGDQQVGVELTPFIDHPGIAYEQVGHAQNSFCKAL